MSDLARPLKRTVEDMKQKVAIIGGGIAGLTAAYLLCEEHDITLFEKDGRLGGNAYTWRSPDGDDIDITVFSFSKVGYKNFFALLSELRVETERFRLGGLAATSYNIDTHETFYLSPLSLRGLRPAALGVARCLLASMKKGVKLLDGGHLAGLSMEQGLRLLPDLKGHAFLHLAFMLCLTSSMSYDEVMDAPATFFFGKVKQYLQAGPTAWRLVKRRTQAYVDAMASRFSDQVVLNSKIRSVARTENDVTLRMETGEEITFDRVVFACPADQALQLLEDPTPDERRLLGAWKYKDGLVVVHRDNAHFPPRSLCNLYDYLYTDRDGQIATSINACYRLQRGVSKNSPYLGTQHPNFPIREELIAFQKVFRTPIFDPHSVSTIAELPKLNGQRNSYYCGSHFGFGLHEDAVTSAINVAKALGVAPSQP
jgi:predicted NAD/FAD-binding protein